MTRYTTLEMTVIAALTAILLWAFPESFNAVIGAIVITFGVLQLVSAFWFCLAIHRGQVIEDKQAPFKYTIKPEARSQWLVMRFVWCYLSHRRA